MEDWVIPLYLLIIKFLCWQVLVSRVTSKVVRYMTVINKSGRI